MTSALTTSRPELRAYQDAGVFTPADIHTAVALCRLGGETDDRVLLAAALTVRALRQGSVCVALNDYDTLVADITATGEEAAALDWPAAAAVLAAVTLPITALASIYGMNVIVNEQTHVPQLLVVLAVMVAMSGALLRWTKRQGWW